MFVNPLPEGEGKLVPASPPDRPSSSVRPTHYWTWRLLSAGFSVDDCSAIRGVSRQEILAQALRSIEEGLPVRAETCLSAELVAALKGVIGSAEPAQIRPLLARLPGGTSYQEVELFLKSRRQARNG